MNIQQLGKILEKFTEKKKSNTAANNQYFCADEIHGIVNENEKLKGEVKSLSDENKELQEELEKLKAKNKELENRLNMTSRNSSKPPSTDGFMKLIKNHRVKTGKKPGGQIGHKGSTLELSDKINNIVEIRLHQCPHCNSSLDGVKQTYARRQKHDIPPIKKIVTEYRAYRCECPACHKEIIVDFPPDVTQPVEYGPNLRAFVLYLSAYQLLPVKRTVETLYDILKTQISGGTIANIIRESHEKLQAFEVALKSKIIRSDVVNFDETGCRTKGKNYWIHIASTEDATLYKHHENRGHTAMDEIGILPVFKGTAVHDALRAYNKYSECSHALCNAHSGREMLAQQDLDYAWAKELYELMITMNDRVNALKLAGQQQMPETEIKSFEAKYDAIIQKGNEEEQMKNPKIVYADMKRHKNSKAKNLLLRLHDFKIEYLTFMYDFKVPFTNNLAERDARMGKLKIKISGCFRSTKGGEYFCRNRSYISTAKKNGLNIMDALAAIFKSKPITI
jgi:transposase